MWFPPKWSISENWIEMNLDNWKESHYSKWKWKNSIDYDICQCWQCFFRIQIELLPRKRNRSYCNCFSFFFTIIIISKKRKQQQHLAKYKRSLYTNRLGPMIMITMPVEQTNNNNDYASMTFCNSQPTDQITKKQGKGNSLIIFKNSNGS